MAVTVRQTTPDDGPQWLSLVRAVLGEGHPAKEVYDTSWIISELGGQSGTQTWVAESDGQFQASVTILPPFASGENPVVNLGRNLFRPESYEDGSAQALLDELQVLDDDSRNMIVTRVLSSDIRQQGLFEKAGYVCAGYQPFKHIHGTREGVLFFIRVASKTLPNRVPLSESMPQIAELTTAVLGNCKLPPPGAIRDGITGYPLKTEIDCQDATQEEFDLWHGQADAARTPKEISGSFNLGFGYMRLGGTPNIKAALAKREDKVVAGISYYYDEHDRCVRMVDGFALDDLSMGATLQYALQQAQDVLSAVYVEMDILSTAPRLIKSAEQLGFVPVAYLPAFSTRDGFAADVVKMVKLNTGYSLENVEATPHADRIIKIVDFNFKDQKTGVAIINLLRGLPIFEGLGDGELRKIARLFTQKLYRPNEVVFAKGETGNEAYVVMRGKIDICLNESAAPIASLADGQIFGEQAFLDGSERGAMAKAGQASILLVVKRSNFNDLVQREPHLGMVVMQNIARDLSIKLKRANTALTQR